MRGNLELGDAFGALGLGTPSLAVDAGGGGCCGTGSAIEVWVYGKVSEAKPPSLKKVSKQSPR
jgi:hypothetical protein